MSIEDQQGVFSQKGNGLSAEKKVPKVSIGMPVYNGEPFIREALNSLLAQTFTDFELIISDNASTDGTEEICREYAVKDARVRYVRQVDNKGATANFKFVLDEAVGFYFMWAAADDLQTPDFIDVLVTTLDENPSFVCAMSDVKNINSNNCDSFLSVLDDARVDDVKKNWPKRRMRFFRNPTSCIFFCIYGLFVTKIIKSVDLNYKNLYKYALSSEIPFLAQVAILGKIATIPKSLKIYRRHVDSLYHVEQKQLKRLDRLISFFSISWILFLIIFHSNIFFKDKFPLFLQVASSGVKYLLLNLFLFAKRVVRNSI